MSTILFYRERDQPYGCFSNFSRHPFTLQGHEWPTVEHFFQAQKFPGTEQYGRILHAVSPKEAKVLGNSREFPMRPDWDLVKDQIMFDAVYQKFATHEDIRAILLGTGSDLIEEAAYNDSYWGTGADGNGRNQLGITLVAVREELRLKNK